MTREIQKKSVLFLITFFFFGFLLSTSVQSAQTQFTFTENFPTTTFTQSIGCKLENTLTSGAFNNGTNISFDNGYKCIKLKSISGNYENPDDVTEENTQYGLRMKRTSGIGSASCVYLGYVLNTTYSITTDSIFSYHNYWYDNFKYENTHLVGINNNGSVVWDVPIQGGCGYATKPSSAKCCNLMQSNYSTIEGKINFTGQDLINQCSYDLDAISEFDIMAIASCYNDRAAPQYETNIDDISITLYNGTNEIPTGNFSTEFGEYCYNSSVGYTFVPFNISYSDVEKDTIYYATSLESEIYNTSTIDFGKEWLFGLTSYVFESSYNLFYENNTNCKIRNPTTNLFYNTDFINYKKYSSLRSEKDIFLELQPLCNGDKILTYEYPNSYSSYLFNYDFYDLGLNQTLGINLLSEDDSYNLKFRFNSTDGINYTLYNYNGTGYEVLKDVPYSKDIRIKLESSSTNNYDVVFYNISLSSYDVTILPFTEINNTIAYSGVKFLGGSYINDLLNNPEEDNINRFEIDYYNTTVLFNQFDYKGVKENISFSTVKPGGIIFYKPGLERIDLYVSDEVNQPSNYIVDSVWINVNSNDETCLLITDFEGVQTEDGTKYFPQFNNEFVNNFLHFLRIPRILLEDLGWFSMWNVLINSVLIYMILRRYQKMTFSARYDQDTILNKLFTTTFVSIFMLYFMFLLITKSLFVFYSILGLLFLSKEFYNALFTNNDNNQYDQFLSMSLFNFIAYFYFKFVGIATNINFNVPVLSESLSFSNLLIPSYYIDIFGFFYDLLFFTIPDIPIYLSYLLTILRIASILSLLVLIVDKILKAAESLPFF